MSASPVFAATPRCGMATATTADTSRTAPGNAVTVFTAAASGSRIDKVVVKATGNTTAGLVRLFIHDNSNYFLEHEVVVSAITASATVASFREVITFPEGLILPANYSLRATTDNGEDHNVIAYGADF
jgi:hypothetical protein